MLADTLRQQGLEVHEKVHCISEDDSTRRSDIVDIDRKKHTGTILDPTLRSGIQLRCEYDLESAPRMREERVGARGDWRPFRAWVKIYGQCSGHGAVSERDQSIGVEAADADPLGAVLLLHREDRIHHSGEEKDDHIKDSFYEELQHTFDQLPRYHMKTLLGDFNAKVGQEDIFRPTIGKESLHVISSDNGVRLVNFAPSKNLIVKSTTFPHKDINKYTWTSLDGLTHNQIVHILIDKRRHTSIVDIRTFRGADCNSDHYLVIGELRERLSVAKRVEQQVNITKFNILKLKEEETKQNYQVEISNRFASLESSDEVEKELDVNSVWENIRDNIKIAAEQSIGYYETKKKKPWFDEDCCIVVERRKQAKLKFLQDPVEEKRDNYFNERREASRTLRNKKRGYLKEKLNEVETNSKNKNIRDLYKGNKGI
ncbi:hypothetical protein ANN_22378 [Periplaneta americana]|uniref:Endonuclease/exonuclease/phosphatase domain-containing protein n=1 Tax=Periplaneta americana TaxID=6978 RepID=A0ABQ8S7Z9_PERAM|nr:hypothetical protein ANN_22378 [Periplaneta americana]